MAATNYAIEGVTGDWCKMVWNSKDYKFLFKEGERKRALKWIHAHAAYDDKHPVEALDTIYSLLGNNPDLGQIQRVKHAVQKSYDLYNLALDVGMCKA